MKVILLVLLLFISDVKPETNISETRIIGGSSATDGIHRSMVYIKAVSMICGGTILNVDFVLTAGHCVHGKSADDVKVTSSSTTPKSDGYKHHVTNIVVHEEFVMYERLLSINDIALLKVSPRFSLESGEDKAVTLPKSGEEVFPGELATAVGWGRTEPGGGPSLVLQEVDLRVVSDEECESSYRKKRIFDPDMHICAGRPLGETQAMGTCPGDSGGPLFVRKMQVGITSFTTKPCGSKPGVFTEVSRYIDWINSHVV